MTNKNIARALAETAALIELTGGNIFRARALSSAARTIKGLDESVYSRIDAGTITDIEGIGEGLAAQINELVTRGSFELRDELMNAVPHGLPALLRVKGLGTKKVRRLWKELGITSLDELETVAASGTLVTVEGFGAKTQANILKNVKLQRQYDARKRFNEALVIAEREADNIAASGLFQRVEIAGDLRRNMETVDRIDLVAAIETLDSTVEPDGYQPNGSDWPDNIPAHHYAREVDGAFPIHVTIVPATAFGTALWYATGSASHRQLLINEAGEPSLHTVEDKLFTEAGLSFIPPELREGDGEVKAARSGSLPQLITVEDLQGTLHNHSTYSDGAHTLRAMAQHARSMGLSYFGICDHSQSLSVASGLSISEVEQQQTEIRQLNGEYADDAPPFKIYSGIESDILADGSLDYPDEVLAAFDFVVASVHSRFNMNRKEGTERLTTAIENPYTAILGHATGRLLLVREGYDIDHDRIIEACAEHNVAIELNSNPYRLDMDWRFLKKATDRGVLISINPDAHSTSELGYVRWGVAVGRKAWLTAEQCLNAYPLDTFEKWIANQGRSSQP